jgi:hypothetical protein
MRVFAALIVLILGVVAAGGSAAFAAGVCVPADEGQLRCTIRKLSDCRALRDYPYARNLFCPAAFSAVQTMVSEVARTLRVKAPVDGFFYYFQTLADPQDPPDDQSQTKVPCLDTRAPWGSRLVAGAGTPLCHLVAYVTSLGPLNGGEGDWGKGGHSRNPVPQKLRGYPEYFAKLYAPRASFPLTEFHTGSVFDRLVRNLGLAGHDEFIDDYPFFSTQRIYDPAYWRYDPKYFGISGGGGGGWGGEIAVLGEGGSPVILLAFGGGGGGGFTSHRQSSSSGKGTSVLGAGGGGGMQFANGYRFENQHYNGLGLGAGAGSDEGGIQYSYNDYEGSPSPPLPPHQYNPAVIAEYQAQLVNLANQLQARFAEGKSVVLKGGGGMGAGTEYLRSNGDEYVPHALSTQAGFQFSYEFRDRKAPSAPVEQRVWKGVNAQQEDAYSQLGEFYRRANKRALEQCGGDYSNYACICPKAQAIVICLMGEALGDPKKIPTWMQEQHCPDPDPANPANGLTRYQQVLFDWRGTDPTEPAAECGAVLLGYFNAVNTPAAEPY